MFSKVVFVLVSIGFVILIGLLGRDLTQFTIERISNSDSLASYWGFWLLWLGPVVIGISAIVAGITEWIHPTQIKRVEPPPAIDSWVLPR